MKTRTSLLVGLVLLAFGPASLAAPQRGSKGSSSSASQGSRGSGGGSISRPSSSQGSRGSSAGPRPSSGSSRPSAMPSSGRGSSSGGSIRPASPSVRPSSPPAARPDRGGSTPSRPSSSVSPRPSPTSPSAGFAPTRPATPTSSGREIYGGRTLPSSGRPSSTSDSAPTAGPTTETPGVGTSDGTADWSYPSTPPRVRFPAPYSPAGSTTRGARPSSNSGGTGLLPKTGVSAGSPTSGTSFGGSSSAAGPGRSLGGSGAGKPGSGPIVRYDHGPTGRTVPGAGPKASGPKGSGSSSSKPGLDASKGKGPTHKGPTTKDVAQKDWSNGKSGPGNGAVSGGKGNPGGRGLDPQSNPKSKEVFVATKLAGRAVDIATGAAVGSVGGVYGGGFRGGLDLDDDWVNDPWGCGGWSQSSWCWSSCGWNAWWSFPCYWSWYYPCWWWYSRPYYYYDYCAYQPIATVVYAEPSVVYVQSDSAGYVSEPTGEAVASAPVGRIAPPASEASPLSIAAQRYLELGDRAFREGRYTDAVQFYAKAVEFAPDQGALYLVLSDALFAAGDYHYGAYAVRRALELDPALVESQVDKHGFYADPGQFDQQLATLEGYLGDHPSDRDARLVLAMNYLFGGRASDAVRTLVSPAAMVGEDVAAQKILARARALTQ